MLYSRLGKAGVQVSRLSYGAWVTFATQIGKDTAKEIMAKAYDSGVNFFDNAEAYARGDAERLMGEILSELGWRRSSYLVSSKVYFGSQENRQPNEWGLSRKHIFEACDEALQRLRVDYLDLYFCHRYDPTVPVEEVVYAMNDLVRMGKVHYWGTSEWRAWQIQEAHTVARQYGLIPPTMEQPQYNMFHRERVEKELADLFAGPGLGTTIWSPLSSGILTGKYLEGDPGDTRISLEGYEWLRKMRFEGNEFEQELEKVRRMNEIANELGTTMARMALAWVLTNENVSTAITGASRVGQLEENLKAIDDVEKMTPDVLARIEEILGNNPNAE